jgi:arylsulfatase
MPRLVLAMCVDCLRRDQVGAYGCAKATTPCIDGLAARSLVLDHAYANANWTKPSVASFFTGLWPAEHGAVAAGDVKGQIKGMALPQGVATLAGVYAAAGYRTVGFVHQPHLIKEHGFGQGFETYEAGPFEAERIAALFKDWHAKAGRTDRVFAYLHFLDCHAPYWPHQPFAQQFGPTSRAWASCPDWETPGVWARFRDEVNAGKRTMPREEAAELLNLYEGSVRYTDITIERILADLSARDAFDEALVIVFADHGEDFLEHGTLGHDPPFFFEEQIRIPVVIKFPASWGMRPAHITCETQTLDVTAMLAAIVGREGFGHGRNLLVSELFSTPVPIITQSAAGMTVLRSGLKGYVWTRGALPQIMRVIDARRDAAEGTDLAAQTPGFVSDMERYLASWQQSTARVYAALGAGSAGAAMSKENAEALRALGYVH